MQPYFIKEKLLMKHFTICLFFSFAGFLCSAQNNTTNTTDLREQYLFEKFAKGVVLMKDGSIENASLNYNTADQSVVFEKDATTVLTLTGLENIDSIYFRNKRFIPGADGRIYEVIIPGKPAIGLFVTYTNKMKPATAVTDQSGTSHKEAAEVSNTMTGVYVLRPYKGDYLIEIQRNFWLIKSKQIYKAATVRQFEKVFPHQDNFIEKYIAENQVNFKLEDDLVKLTLFCNEKL